MELEFVIIAGIVLVLGTILQSAAGFGFGMFAIPLLILLGRESYEAIAVLSICGTVQTLGGMYALRREINWRLVIGMTIVGGAFLPLGVWTLSHITHLSPDRVRQVFGAIVLLAVIAQWVGRVKSREQLHWGWFALALPISGFMAGMSGMGGPPVVMWIMAHQWSNPKSRVTLWAYFTGLTPFQLFFLHQRFGEPVLDAIATGAVLSPAVLLGLIPGLWLGRHISKPLLRRISYVILLLIALYAIVGPMVWKG
jgi:uncharacterized membrane protein YfcA